MCARATLTEHDLGAVAAALQATADAEASALFKPRWNAAPGERLLVAVEREGQRILTPARWGLPVGGRVQVNLRAETSGRGRSRPEARCVLPVDGFYEWTGAPGQRRPIWFHRRGGGVLLLAAVRGATPEGQAFAVLTLPAAPPVDAVHDRMPALLMPDQLEPWLLGAELLLQAPPPDLLVGREVSTRVNRAGVDDPACLEEPEPDPQLGLFGR
jgi:putative SOS response-associated peptidase YedK